MKRTINTLLKIFEEYTNPHIVYDTLRQSDAQSFHSTHKYLQRTARQFLGTQTTRLPFRFAGRSILSLKSLLPILQMSSLLPAIEDLNKMLPSPESSPALAFSSMWHTITTALNNILPSQQNIPSPLQPNEPDQLWRSFTHKQQAKIQ
jgi:hypothetical protein